MYVLFFFKQKTAYEMRISDWSSDVCSSDLLNEPVADRRRPAAGRDVSTHAAKGRMPSPVPPYRPVPEPPLSARLDRRAAHGRSSRLLLRGLLLAVDGAAVRGGRDEPGVDRISDRAGRTREGSEAHTYELQS